MVRYTNENKRGVAKVNDIYPRKPMNQKPNSGIDYRTRDEGAGDGVGYVGLYVVP